MRKAPFLLLIALLWSFVSAGAMAQRPDNRSYCLADGAIAIVAVDTTTPYDDIDKTAIADLVNQAMNALKGGDRLIIRTISGSHTESERLADQCMPQCQADGMIGRLFHCSDGILRTDTTHVRNTVQSALKNRLTRFDGQPTSDIARTLQDISNQEIPTGRRATVYVFSDLIENSDVITGPQLFQLPTPKLMAKAKLVLGHFKGAVVRVAGIGRTGTPDRRALSPPEQDKLRQFWTEYFLQSGAGSSAIDPQLAHNQ